MMQNYIVTEKQTFPNLLLL